jgi:hypothetical protein
MTAQIPDIFFYKGKPYELAGISGTSELFNPAAYDMQPVGTCTACWRGYQCGYAIGDNGQLILRDFSVSLGRSKATPGVSQPVPILFGVKPTADREKESWFNVSYKEMSGPIPYTGGLLIADDFIRELYVHMGFHPAWKYRDVHELIFENGLLKSATDRSEQMAQLREGMNQSPEPDFKDIGAWVEKCFSLKYSG